MSDYIGNELQINDKVAIVCREDHRFFLQVGIVKGETGIKQMKTIVVLPDGTETICPVTDGNRTKRIVKIMHEITNVEPCDFAGQAVHVGDVVVFQDANEYSRFEDGGVVVKITEKTVFVDQNGVQKKKSLKKMIVVYQVQ